MKRQVGLFFLLLGLLGLILFVATFLSNSPIWSLGLVSILFTIFGGWLISKSRTPPPTEERFRSYRRFRSRKEEKKKEK